MPHVSPLRYPGGKAFVAPFLAETIRLNGLTGGTYAEPFAGGSGAALNLLLGEHTSEIFINDKDKSIYCFWRSVLDHSRDLIRLIATCEVSVRNWHVQKAVLKNPREHSTLEIGFAAFFLNRCNHSGVLNGGPIGGLRQRGSYKIGVRFNREELIKRVERIHLYRSRIHLSCQDALIFMERMLLTGNPDPERTLVYLDPPYLEKAKRLYPLYFVKKDHERLALFLGSHKEVRWIVSYDDVTPIRKLYDAPKKRIWHNYCVQSARVGRELLISSPACLLPAA